MSLVLDGFHKGIFFKREFSGRKLIRKIVNNGSFQYITVFNPKTGNSQGTVITKLETLFTRSSRFFVPATKERPVFLEALDLLTKRLFGHPKPRAKYFLNEPWKNVLRLSGKFKSLLS